MNNSPNAGYPQQTEYLIIGGGIVGASVAYHLTLMGKREVTLLEQGKLGGGTTWHSAGMVGRLRTSSSMTVINKYSAELYSKLEEETGHPVNWRQVGSLIVGKSEDRMTQLRRTTAMAEMFGVEAHMISPEEAQAKYPPMRSNDLYGAAWLPHDGKVDPGEVPVALAKGAQSRGAKVFEETEVTGLIIKNGRACGATLKNGEKIHAETVILCGGMWSRQFAVQYGVDIPLYPMEHHYIVSEDLTEQGGHDLLPLGRDPDLCIYFRGEGPSICLGAFQRGSKPWNISKIPSDFVFQLFESDWEKFAEPLKAGRWRIPALEKCEFPKFVNGPESFTPDNNFIMGEAPALPGLFVAAGFNSVGIASAGGAGKFLAEWLIEGQPTMDLWSVDIRRFSKLSNQRWYLRDRVPETLSLHYEMAWPNREMESARNLKLSPLHDRLAAHGAWFGSKNGWERPNFFAGAGVTPSVQYSFGKQNWWEFHRREHLAARNNVALFDQTGFGKLDVTGPDACAALQRLCANQMDTPVGAVIYTAMLNERAGFESDLTAVRLGQNHYRMITGTAQPLRDRNWIERNLIPGEQVNVQDVTSQYSVIGVMGPRSRKLLSQICDNDWSLEAFPFGTAQWVDLGHSTVLAVRVTYVGELGWELHIPTEQTRQVYDLLLEAGAPLNVRNAGHYAINSLRLEKAYRAWGAELTPDENPLEAGLSFAVDFNKAINFIGKTALLKAKESGLLKKRLAALIVEDPDVVLWGSEPIRRDGKAVGYTSSAAYGHALNGSVALGYIRNEAGVTKDFLEVGSYTIENDGRQYPARLSMRSPYDPARKRILV